MQRSASERKRETLQHHSHVHPLHALHALSKRRAAHLCVDFALLAAGCALFFARDEAFKDACPTAPPLPWRPRLPRADAETCAGSATKSVWPGLIVLERR